MKVRARSVSVGAALLVIGPGAALAQSINIDLDVPGPPEGGGGAPSSQFAAVGSRGFWNQIDAGGPRNPISLLGLDGSPTQCQLVATGGIGSSGGFNNHGISGDYRLLMSDFEYVGNPIRFQFSGFSPGRYRLWTYSGNVSDEQGVSFTVQVPGSLTPAQTVAGPIPTGNRFIYGLTHCYHDLLLPFGGAFEIDVSSGFPDGMVSGIQIQKLPWQPGIPSPAFPWGWH